jgi:hypothetical protein
MNSSILVTGAHRSGTTWVGKMLAASDAYAYVSEPLNVLHRQGVFNAPVAHWYTYICKDNQDQYLSAFRETLALNYHTWEEIKSLRSPKDVGRMLRDWRIFSRGRQIGSSALLKDPFAVFSAEWFARQLDCQVIITVRHPAGFVSSLQRYGWSFNFIDLLDQPLLMRDWLRPFKAEMEAVQEAGDPIRSACLLWRMVYQVVRQYQERGLPFFHLRHEDLSREPVEEFRLLYTKLALPFTPEVETFIRQSTSAENPEEVSKSAKHSVKLDSRANIKNWKKRLTGEEIARVRELTADVASYYYTDKDWE